MPEQLMNAECPEDMIHIWDYFLALHGTRQSGMVVCGITYTEIQAWSLMTKINVSSTEVETIKRIDAIFLDHYHKTQKAKK